jgi:hypothetical protein
MSACAKRPSSADTDSPFSNSPTQPEFPSRDPMQNLDDTRRRFMAHFASIGLGSTLLPGVLWTRMQDAAW